MLLSKWKWKLAQALEWRWWRRYLSKQSQTTYLQNKRAYWARVLQQAEIHIETGESILDAGCGPAGLFILPFSGKVDALDPLIEQYRQNLAHFDSEDYPNVRFMVQPLETFNAPLLYDKVFCFNAINHVSDLQACITNLAKALRPNGLLIASVDAHNKLWLKKIFQWLPGDVLHPQQYGVEEYCSFFAQQNLKLIRCKTLRKAFIFNYYLMVFEKTAA